MTGSVKRTIKNTFTGNEVKTGLIMKSSRLRQSVSLQAWMALNGETNS